MEVPKQIIDLAAKHPAIATLVTSIVPLLAPQPIAVRALIGYMFVQFLGGKEKTESLSEKELEKKFDEFKKYLEDILKDLKNMEDYVKACGIDYLPRILNLVNRDNKDKDIEDFLKGLRPTWNIIIDSIDIKRKEENEIIEKLKDNKNVLLLGNSGSGKSVLLKRLAHNLMKDYDVFFSTGFVDSGKATEFIREYSSPDKRALVIIDNILAYKGAITDLVTRAKQLSLNVNFVLSEQIEKWQEESFSILNFETVKITLDEETKKQYIEKYSKIKHKTFSKEEQEEMISASRDVFPILVLLSSGEGKSLEKVIDDMYNAIEENEKEIMKAILFPASYDVEIPEELIRSVYNDGEIIGSLSNKGLIKIDNDLISTQHPFIAGRILENKFRLNKADEERIIDNLIKAEDKKEYFKFFLSLGDRRIKERPGIRKIEPSVKLLKKAIKINPNDAYAHYNLGILLYGLQRYEKVEKEYREAIRIDPNAADAHRNLAGLLFYDLKRYDEAENEYREIIRISSSDDEACYAHCDLGSFLYRLKRYNEAENEYREAIKIDPDHFIAHDNLADLLYRLKRYDEAKKERREAIRTLYYPLREFLSFIRRSGIRQRFETVQDLKHYKEAKRKCRESERKCREAIKEAIKINPNDADAHTILGVFLLTTGREGEAKQEILKARKIFDDQGRVDDVKKCNELLKDL